MSSPRVIKASSPGRVCLFGEHQDYLGLPVIAAAIDLRMWVEGEIAEGDEWIISKPDLGEEDRFRLSDQPLAYPHGSAADFLRSALNLVRREGVTLPPAARFRIRGEVPVQAGTSSSSALQVAWIAALLALGESPLVSDPETLARFAFISEVEEFAGSGGMMDQCTSALGRLVWIDPGAGGVHRPLPARLGSFVLGHSCEPKDTQAMLSRVQGMVRQGADWLGRRLGRFDWSATPLERAQEIVETTAPQDEVLQATLGALRNRDLLHLALGVLSASEVDHRRLGELLTAHHTVLRDDLGISTAKIDRMLDAAIEAGALGGKINGSGGGGCMFAYAPESADVVAEALRREGGDAWVVDVCSGVEVRWAEGDTGGEPTGEGISVSDQAPLN
jgi:galactokinase